MSLEEIKNNYAVSKGYDSWDDLLKYFINEDSKFYISTIVRHENEVMKIYAMECLKLASDEFIDDNGLGSIYRDIITNENNIIK